MMLTCSENKPVCTVPIVYGRGVSELVQHITLGLFLQQNTLWEGFWEKRNPTKKNLTDHSVFARLHVSVIDGTVEKLAEHWVLG